MIEYIIILILIFSVGDIESKLNTIIKSQNEPKKKEIRLKEYIGKEVSLSIDNDEVSNSYLFSSIYSKTGIIKDYDKEWLLFEYQENKKSKKTIQQYIRISDITSINEITKK